MRRLAWLPLLLLLSLPVACGDGPGPAPNAPATAALTPTRPGWSGEVVVSPPPIQAGTPQEATISFYRWYLGFANSPDPAQNPLANRIYAQSSYLTPGLVEAVDRFLISLDEQGFPALDPLLCAATPPREFTLAGSVQNGERTLVLVRTDLPRHGFTVHLEQAASTWSIADITCAAAPDGVATAFYVWYLGQETAPGTTGVYAESDYLSLALIERARQQIAAGGPDPFTLAAEPPARFRVSLEGSVDSVILETTFADGSAQRLRLRFVQAGGDWLIDAVTPVEP